MQWLLVFPGYFIWHYTSAFKQIWRVWMNFLWFINHLFSLPLLITTIFSPWKRIVEDQPAGFDLERWAENLTANLMSRLVGAMVRTPIILLGLISLVATFLGGLALYAFWLIAPFIIPALVLIGVYNLL